MRRKVLVMQQPPAVGGTYEEWKDDIPERPREWELRKRRRDRESWTRISIQAIGLGLLLFAGFVIVMKFSLYHN